MKARPAVLLLLAIPWTATPAHAQDEPPTASIQLVSQTPWTTPDDPELRLVVRIRNEGSTSIDAPEVGWTLGPRIGARDQYEAALRDGPSFATAADTTFLPSPLAPGEAEEVALELDTASITAIAEDESGVYPLQVELRNEGEPIVALTTAAIHVAQPPQVRVLFSWWTELDVPIAFGPDGRLLDPTFEETLAAGGGVVAQVRALASLAERAGRPASAIEPAFDVVISPATLDQLEQAADGYRRLDGSQVPEEAAAPTAARETLRSLRELASSPAVALHAVPFAAPRIPTLASVLGSHLDEQWALGDATFERLLGEPPDPTVARPPALAFDEATLDRLAERGTTTVLGAADSVARPTDELERAPAPAAVVTTAAGTPVRIVLPDPSTQALVEDPELRRDPVLLAQATLGELATIWREQPVPEPPTVRGLALDLPSQLPGSAWEPFVRRLTTAPFLEQLHARDLPGAVVPAPEEAGLERHPRRGFSADYLDDLFTTARDVTAFESMVRQPVEEPERLRRAILYAESSRYVGDEAGGRMWIDAVNAVTDPTFDDLAPDTTRVLTFTSRTGRIPLRMGDPGDRVVQVRVELVSQRVDFLGAGERTVRLDRPDQLVTFDAEVKAAGRSSIDVYVYSPSGLILAKRVLVVSSTAINPIALIITLAAGLTLVGLWSRRLFRRRNP
jgi:hypothetical protein